MAMASARCGFFPSEPPSSILVPLSRTNLSETQYSIRMGFLDLLKLFYMGDAQLCQ